MVVHWSQSRWISLAIFHLSKVLTSLSRLYINSLRWHISFHAQRLSTVKRHQILLCMKDLDIVAFSMTSSMIETYNSSLNFENIFLLSSKFILKSIRAIIQRLMVKRNVSIKHRRSIHCFIYKQDYWVDYLCFVEFSYNNAVHSSTKFASLFTNKGCPLHWTMIKHPKISKNVAIEDPQCRLQEIHITLSHHLHNAQATHMKFIGCHHLDWSP